MKQYFFYFPTAYMLYLQHTVVYYVCNSIMYLKCIELYLRNALLLNNINHHMSLQFSSVAQSYPLFATP